MNKLSFKAAFRRASAAKSFKPTKILSTQIKLGFISSPFIFSMSLTGCAPEPDHFGIYISRLDGGGFIRLLADQKHEINHARMSKDRNWITFTKYNHIGSDGFAREEGSYAETEIMTMGKSAANLKSLLGQEKGMIHANGYPTPDGRSILFVCSDKQSKLAGYIARFDLGNGKVTKIEPSPPIPNVVAMADPHQVGNLIVFTAALPVGKQILNQLWTMNSDGTQAKRLTNPISCLKEVGQDNPPAGDFDPKIAPDGNWVACMRHLGKDRFDIMLVRLSDNSEYDISAPNTKAGVVDAVPEFSADGKTLVFWHADKEHPQESGIWIMSSLGKNRKRVALPHGFFYSMPAFLPGETGEASGQIIFSGRRQEGI